MTLNWAAAVPPADRDAFVPWIAPDPAHPTRCLATIGTDDRRIRPAQQDRRAQILAEGRRQLSERGYDGLSVQDLAATLHMSKQTVYNLVGGKREIVATAIIDHLSIMADIVGSSSPDILILHMVQLYCNNFLKYSEYTRQATLAMFHRDRLICSEIRCRQRAWFLSWLRKARDNGLIRDDVDLVFSSRQLVVLNEGNMLDWANGLCCVDELNESLVMSHGLMLLGISSTTGAATIEAWMAEHL